MLSSGKIYAVDISSLKRISSVKRGYAPQWQNICSVDISSLKRICSGHTLLEEDMLSQERICSPVAKYLQWTYPLWRGYAQDIPYLKRICSVKSRYAPQWQRICSGHILFEEDMLRTYPLGRGYAQSREDMLPSCKIFAVDISSLKRICSGHTLFEEDMLSQE
jgi:hypothetical protein